MSLFAFLPLDERIRLREVCASWKHALDDNRNWRAIDFAVMGPVGGRVVPPMLRWALERHGPDMHDLSTRGCHVNDDTLQIVGAHCPNLEVLIVDEPPPDREDDPSSILALSAPPAITQAGLASLSGCHQLTRLDASRSSASPAALQALARALPFLAYVKLGGPRFTDAHTAALVPSGRDMLALDLSGSPVTDVALRTVALHCPRLRMLNCEGSAGITDGGLSALVFGCRELRILLVSGCRQLSDSSLTDVAHTCPQLHRLDAARLPRITNAAVEVLAERCEALESITLLGCPKITADGLAVIVSDCVQLRQLAVDGVGLHSVVEELAPQGLGLTALTIRRCGGLTDTAAAALASSCPAVTSLDLSGSPLVGFTHLAAGALVHRLRSLHSLSLAECGVTDQSLALFPIARPRIASLDLSRNPGLTDVGVELALRACAPTLTSLSLAGCDVGPEAATLLAHSGAALTRLDLRMCPRITDAAVASVLSAVGPSIETLLLGIDAPTIHAASSADIISAVLPDDSPYAVVLEMSLPPPAAASVGADVAAGASASAPSLGLPSAAAAPGAAASEGASPADASGSSPPRAGEDSKKKRRRKKKRGAGPAGAGDGAGDLSAPAGGEEDEEGGGGAEEPRPGPAGAPSVAAAPMTAAAKKRARRRRRAAAKSGKAAAMLRMPLGDGTAAAVADCCPRLRSLHLGGCEGLTLSGLGALESAVFARTISSAFLGVTPCLTVAAARRLGRAWTRLRVLSVPVCGALADHSDSAITAEAAAGLQAELRATQCPEMVVDVLPPRWGPPEPVQPPFGTATLHVGPLPPPGMVIDPALLTASAAADGKAATDAADGVSSEGPMSPVVHPAVTIRGKAPAPVLEGAAKSSIGASS